MDTCLSFPLTTATTIKAIIGDIEGKVSATRVRYLDQRGQWLDNVLNPSETGISSWVETSRKDELSLKDIEEELLFNGAVLKVLRMVREIIEIEE